MLELERNSSNLHLDIIKDLYTLNTYQKANFSSMFVTTVLVLIVLCLLYLIIRTRLQKLNYFKLKGIPGPAPNLLFGNLHQLAGKKFIDGLADWTKEYGSIYGYYEGSCPVIVSSDPELLKEVYIKQFNNFYGRRLLPVQPEPDTGADKDVHMLFSRGHRWKRLRSTISPSFSKSKMKQMLPLIKLCIDETMTILDKKSSDGEAFDIHRVLQGLTIDVIGTCAFGLEPHFQKKKNDPFLFRIRRLFTDFSKRPFIVILGAILPEFRQFWWKLVKLVAAYTYDDMDWLFTNLGDVIERRKTMSTEFTQSYQSSSQKPVDLLQLLIDAEVGTGSSRGNSVSHLTMSESDEDLNSNYELDGHHNFSPEISQDSSVSYLKSKLEEVFHQQQIETIGKQCEGHWNCPEGARCESPKTRLSLDEVKATSVVFLIAGYETISNLLSYVTYEMAVNPHIQVKVQSELDEVFPDEVDCCIEKLNQLKYLEMVISEVLRIYPIAALFTGRLCMKETVVKGLHIDQGVTVQPDVNSLHNDPAHWGPTDPKIFDPERFTPEAKAKRHPMAYMPFGAGPKNCVGMRFALTECKLTLARLFKQYRVEPTEKTSIPCETIETASLTPKSGIMVRLVPRSVECQS